MMSAFLSQHAPALLIAIPLLAAFATPLVGYAGRSIRNLWVLLAVTLTSLVGLFIAHQVFTTGTIIYVFGAADAVLSIPGDSGGIPIRIIFTIDGMSALMTVIASIVGFAGTIYALKSESERSGQDSFYALLLLLITGVFGMVCTGDMFNFFVFLEIASLAGAALVAYRVDKGVAVEAGLKYAFLSTAGALSFLMGVGILFGQYNTLNMAMLAERIQYTQLDVIALVLMVVPLAMKCGAVPMHFWTPDAYPTAPAAITAMLVVSSQASLYGLARVLYTLYGTLCNYETFGWFVIILGVLSMFIGVTMAIPQKDVKRLMAYHAVSQTGYMLLGLGVGIAVLGNKDALNAYGTTAMAGGIFHIINHAMYKGLLFLTAGVVFYRTGTRNLNKLGGLGHSMPITMIFFMIGALAIAGIPPFNGFASKVMIYESVFKFNPFLSIIAMVVSILTLASFVKVFHSIYMGPKLSAYSKAKEAPLSMLIGMGVLAVVVVVFGLIPDTVVNGIITPAVEALVDKGTYISTVLGSN